MNDTATETTAASSEDPAGAKVDLSNFDGYTKLYEDVDFGGRVFKFALQQDDGSNGGTSIDLYSEDMDVISTSIRERNSVVEKLYNCKIDWVFCESPQTLAEADISGNTSTIDIYSVQYASSLYYTNDQNYNLYNLGINFENPWWDAAYVQTYTFDKNGTKAMYGAMGDYNYSAFGGSYVLFYNIDLYAQNAFCKNYDIYQLVRDKKWTMDMFMEMIKAVKSDVNGNSTYTYKDNDIMGWIRTQHATHAMHVASDKQIIVNKDGKLVFEPSADPTGWSAVMEKAIEVYKTEGAEDVGYTSIPAYFAGNKALFVSEVLSTLEGLKDYDVSVGLVPYPLYSETQENYRNYVDNHLAPYHIPISFLDTETVGAFFELFACHSRYIVRKAIIEAYTVEYFGDEESGEMLDLITSNRMFDPSYLWFSSYESAVGNMIASGKNNITKWIGSKATSVEKDIETIYSDILNNQN